MIPKLWGRDVVRELRHRTESTPVLILTAVTGAQSTIELLNLGADDYMTKPFDVGELIARARALIRSGKGIKSTVLQMGCIRLSLPEQTVSVSGQVVDLSPTEFRILEYLIHRSLAQNLAADVVQREDPWHRGGPVLAPPRKPSIERRESLAIRTTITFHLPMTVPTGCGREPKASRIIFRACSSSSSTSSSRGGRTRGFPIPASDCTSLMS